MCARRTPRQHATSVQRLYPNRLQLPQHYKRRSRKHLRRRPPQSDGLFRRQGGVLLLEVHSHQRDGERYTMSHRTRFPFTAVRTCVRSGCTFSVTTHPRKSNSACATTTSSWSSVTRSIVSHLLIARNSDLKIKSTTK